MKKQTYQLRECSGLQAAGVADGEPVLKRVKIIGWDSKNRRRYLPESVETSLYEGLLVNLNHPASPTESRRIEDRFGRLLNVTKEADGAYGDLRYNPAHPLAETIQWAAVNDPGFCGLSHNAVGTGQTKDGVFVVEKVVSVRAVDLVADPATTQGLFESMDPELDQAGTGDDAGTLEEKIGHLIVAVLKDDGLDAKAKRKKVLQALKLCDDKGDGEEIEDTEEEDESADDKADKDDDEMEESLKQLAASNPAVKSLVERLDSLEAEKALANKRAKALELCEAAKLPTPLRTEVFLSLLVESKDEKTMRALIEDRKAVASIQKPRSTGPAPSKKGGQQMTAKEFAQKMKGGR